MRFGLKKPPRSQIAHQVGNAEGPRRHVVALNDAVHQHAKGIRADRHDVADLVREALAGLVAILHGRELGAEKQHGPVGILMRAIHRLACKVQRIAADVGEPALTGELVSFGTGDLDADMGCDLLNTSASGPIPTSRYCDQRWRLISDSLTRFASGEPGLMVLTSAPISAPMERRISSALSWSPLACSSMTRSSMLETKVTPQARKACRSQGVSR